MKEARDPFLVREHLRRDSQMYQDDMEFSKGHKGAIVGVLNKYTGSDDMRSLVLGWLFDKTWQTDLQAKSSKTLVDAQWYALDRWIDSYQDEDTGKWEVSERFKYEVKMVVDTINLEVLNAPRAVDELFDDSGMVKEAVDLGGEVREVVEDPKYVQPKRALTRFERAKGAK